MIEVLLIAVSLALDAFAVSVSSGISVPGFGWKQAVRMGLYFGFFQFAMPLIGWFLGTSVSGYIEALDHCETESGPVELTCRRLVMLAVATSIDALAVGVSMAFMKNVNIFSSALVIGVVAFGLSVVGGLAGRRLGCLFQKRAELVGGLVLIGIGLKILLEHLLG